MTERVRLLDHIQEPLMGELKNMFSQKLIEDYEDSLYAVKRWSHDPTLPIKPGFVESNLEHTAGMLDILNGWKSFTHLPRCINYRSTALMIIMHDSGEIIVGDAPSQGEERNSDYWQRRKRQEPKMAQRYILSQIPDEEVREEMRILYHRFEQQGLVDLEARATRYIDKIQGTTKTGPEYVFDYKAIGLERPNPATTEHVRNSLAIVIGATWDLQRALPAKAQAELIAFTVGEIERFKEIGYESLANENINKLERLWLFAS